MDREQNIFHLKLHTKNESAWKDLFYAYYAALCNHAARIITDPVIVEDIVQDVFVNLWSGNTQFENNSALTSYLYRAVTNNSLKYLRNQSSELKKLTKWSYSNYELSIDDFSSIVHEEVIRKLQDTINSLTPGRRKIILMSLQGMSGEEIAAELGVTIHTVKQQKYIAYKHIKSKLGNDLALILLLFI